MPNSKITETVLIVDDTDSVAGFIQSVLRDRGYGTFVAQNGTQALVMAQEYRPDLILLDIMMPDIDGYTICQQLKVDLKTKDIPVIFLSALNSTFDKVKAFKCGAVDFVSKPVQNEELLARVKAHLTIGALTRELQNSNRNLEQLVAERTAELKVSNRQLAQLNAQLERTLGEMRSAKDVAESTSGSKTVFLSKMSHEIFNSSNIIEGFAELIMNGSNASKHCEYARCIKESAGNLVAVISQMTEYDDVISGNCRISKGLVSVAEVLGDVCCTFAARAERQGIGIVVNNENPDDLEILTDGHMLFSILSKLVTNSLNFSEGGTVEIGASTSRGDAVFYVKDSGIGISPDFIGSIYEPFARGSKSFDSSGEGLGLGLTVARKYVEMLQGQIWVDSTPGAGTICYVSLPIQASLPGQGSPRLDDARVLVGEDDDSCFGLLCEALSPLGVRLVRARTGKELFETFRQSPGFRMVMSRLRLPMMNGVDAMRLIRRLEPGIPSVAMAPLVSEQDRIDFEESGCAARVDRPAVPDQAREVVCKFLLDS